MKKNFKGKKEVFMFDKKNAFLSRILMISFLLIVVLVILQGQSYAQEIKPDLFNKLRYRHIGPVGNRVSAVVGIPGDPHIYFAGAASGGIWKTEDGGIRWRPVFDDHGVQSIGALAVASSDNNVIWAGTGEAFIRSNISIGNGIYKSTDGGKNWKHMGLEKTGRIGRILIHPTNPDIVFAAALGHCYGPQPERGVFRTTDGGKTWEKVLFVDENTGCSDMALDANNPRILFAGMWQLEIHTWGRESGGPGSGLYKSVDGGSTWNRIEGHGLPKSPLGKIALAIAPSDSNRIYALIETGDGVPWKGQETSNGVLWRSEDGGENWTLVSSDHNLTQRPHYYSRCAVAPDDPDEVYFCAVRFQKSLNGGETFSTAPMTGGDNHDIWIDPTNADRMAVGNDQYISISTNRGKTWRGHGLPIAQMYHVAVDNQIPYYVYGNRQDGPSTSGPSNSLYGFMGIPIGEWHSCGGAESGFAIPDPVDHNIVWSGNYQGALDRYDERSRTSRSVDLWPDYGMGWPAADLKYRFQWTFPIAISPHDHNKVYAGSQHVHMTTDGGQSWKVISPDLSTNERNKQQSSGGLTPDNASVEYACLIFALAESPVEEGVIWAGTNDGLVHVTRDGGSSWTDVTKNIPNLPRWGTVSNIEPSRFDAGTCYITVDFHQVNNRDPYVCKTADYGKSWKLISSDIPKSVFSYAHCVREDPTRKGLLYLGTENAIYVSFNDGENWIPLQSNLPPAPAHWMVVQEHFNDLVVATYGRGFWIMDDITPLQQLTSEVLESEVHLFLPRPAYRFRSKSTPMADYLEPAKGDNPPYGAFIDYYLKSRPKGKIKIEIVDQKKEVVKTLVGTSNVGINRLVWNLRYEPSERIKLRTKPKYADWVDLGKSGWRSYVSWGGPISPLAAPGKYTVKLIIDDQEFTQELVVKKDPVAPGTEEDIQKQLKVLLELRENSNEVASMVNRIEWIRKQIYDLFEMLEESKDAEDIMKEGKELDKKLMELEEHLIQLKLTGGSQDILRWPMKLYGKISMLAGSVASSDYPPTDQALEMHQVFKQKIAAYQDQFKELLDKDIPAFDKSLKENDLGGIVTKIKSPEL
jgi:photosystem II stability/assembly factor-like uncharacterized protein